MSFSLNPPPANVPLDEDTEGEIWIAGPGIARGYHGNAEATSVVTHCVNALSGPVANYEGHVIKTLGDSPNKGIGFSA